MHQNKLPIFDLVILIEGEYNYIDDACYYVYLPKQFKSLLLIMNIEVIIFYNVLQVL